MEPVTPAFASLEAASTQLWKWFAEAALPLWAGQGVDAATGGFREALTVEGEIHDPRRRARVQARQVFVFATAATRGLAGPWADVARRGMANLLARYRRPDGLFVHTVTPGGEVSDPSARLYEHAFVLFALAAMARLESDPEAYVVEARALRDRLAGFRHPGGGFTETDGTPFQANAQMHLFEASLAWEDSGDASWAATADEVAGLALGHFIDPATGALHEIFDDHWRLVRGQADLIEPGHQFEWAWLLHRWAQRRGNPAAEAVARRLYRIGRDHGIDDRRGVVVNRLGVDLAVQDAGARLWGQTEFLRAALTLGEPADALLAANAIGRFLQTPRAGAWHERMRPDGGFVEEPSPATSLYHLTTAILELPAGA